MKPLRIKALPADEVVKLEDVGGPGTWALEVEVEGHPFNARTVLGARGVVYLAEGALHWLDVHAHEQLEKLLEGPRGNLGGAGLAAQRDKARAELAAIQREALAEERDRLAVALTSTQAERDDVRAQFAAANTLIATQREALAELAAIRDAVVTDNSGDDDGWPTSLDAVKAALASWSIALKDSQDESSKLATQRNSARAERDKALADLDRRDTESGRLLRDVEDLGGRLQAAQIEADTARRLLGEVLVQSMLRGAVLTLPEVGEQAGEVDRAHVGVPCGR